MATFKYDDLIEQYSDLESPIADISVSGNSLFANKSGIKVTNIIVDLSSGFEASQAVFELRNTFIQATGSFNNEAIKKYILLGSPVKVSIGYDAKVREVFQGVICRVNYAIDPEGISYVAVTAMDVKAVMMSNHYQKQLAAMSYSAAVKEIFEQSLYQGLQGDDGAYKELNVTDTPDAQSGGGGGGGAGGGAGGAGGGGGNEDTDVSIEMVGESDYEFVVRAAKKFNYEFFCSGGSVIFRKAKADTTVLIELGAKTRMRRLDVYYDMTGIVENVVVRGLDAGKGKVISAKEKNSNKFSQGGKAKQLISGTEYVFIDPTVAASDDAKSRAQSLMEDMSYRFGTLEVEIYGLPEIVPGKFIEINDFGKGVENKYYISKVRHSMTEDGNYITKITGIAAGMKQG